MQERGRLRSLTKLLFDSWAHWFHLVYAAVFVGGALLAGWQDARDIKVNVAYIGLVGYVLVLMIFAGYFILSYSRKARYAEAIASIDVAMAQVGALAVYLDRCLKSGGYERAAAVSSLRTILGSVVNAFNTATAVGNRCCIKMLGRSGEREYVFTLCRDPVSSEANLKKDAAEGTKHSVEKNTDFTLILYGERDYFLCDDVAEPAHYLNTSAEDLNGTRALPYASTLVLPIKRAAALERNDVPHENQQTNFYGFLAIDARARHAYQHRFDVHLASIVSSALYPVFMQMEQLEAQKKTGK